MVPQIRGNERFKKIIIKEDYIMIETLVLAGFLGCLILCLAAGFSLVYALLGGLLLFTGYALYQKINVGHCPAALHRHKKIWKYSDYFRPYRLSHRPVESLRNHPFYCLLRHENYESFLFRDIRVSAVLPGFLPDGNLLRNGQHSGRDLYDFSQVKRYFPHPDRRSRSLRHLLRGPLFAHVLQRQPGGLSDRDEAL